MDLRRFLDLYASETQEHLRLLNRGILDMETADAARATADAFRAAHTIKGLSAAMGYGGVTEIAHGLEDRLAAVREGRLDPDHDLVDELLGTCDALEAAIAAAIEAGPENLTDPDEAVLNAGPDDVERRGQGRSEATSDPAADAPPIGRGAERAARVRLAPGTPIKAARALLVVKAAERTGELRAYEPGVFGDDFDGTVTLVFGPDVAVDAVEAAIRSAGEVDSVTWGPRPSAAPVPAAGRAREQPAEAGPPRRSAQMRIDPARLDRLSEGIGEASVLHARLSLAEVGGDALGMVDRLGVLLSELQRTILSMRMVPVSEVFDRFPRLVRDAARAAGRQVDFRVEGADIELDRAILEDMVDPLVHLLRNAVDHGLESPEERVAAGKPARGALLLRAERERSSVRLQVVDDGRGVDRRRVVARAREAGLLDSAPPHISDDELLRLLSQPGFSTAEAVTALSGRGVGMDAVVARTRAVGGALALETRPGAGTTFTLRLPLTLALAQALRVRVHGEDYAIPLTHVREAVDLTEVMTVATAGRESLRLRSELLPLIRLRSILRTGGDDASESAAVIAEIGERRAALAVDELVGREQILVKTFDPAVGMLPFFSGATVLADGRPALVLDPLSVL